MNAQPKKKVNAHSRQIILLVSNSIFKVSASAKSGGSVGLVCLMHPLRPHCWTKSHPIESVSTHSNSESCSFCQLMCIKQAATPWSEWKDNYDPFKVFIRGFNMETNLTFICQHRRRAKKAEELIYSLLSGKNRPQLANVPYVHHNKDCFPTL